MRTSRRALVAGGVLGAGALAAAGVSRALDPTPRGLDGRAWRLVWREEFDGPLDPQVWLPLRGTREFPYRTPFNASLDDSSFSADHVEVSGGSLRIRWTPRASTVGSTTYPYTTGLATTAPGFAFQYGVCEIRAFVPAASGIAPAFWMLPLPVNAWPPEIDLAEFTTSAGGQVDVRFNVHWHPGADGQIAGFPVYGSDVGDAWHTYTLVWEADRMSVLLDGVTRYEYTGEGIPQQPMYLVLSGGVLRGATPAAGEVRVDHVRVWQR